MFLLQQCDSGNRWIWTRIDHHPCITGEPINQVHDMVEKREIKIVFLTDLLSFKKKYGFS